MIHYTNPYIVSPVHKVTVDLIGMGGTGSQVIGTLGRMNYALTGLGHPGLHVRAWDPDIVTESNMGRQLFSPADLNLNKAQVLITRMNRFFGTEWESVSSNFTGNQSSNITISCVDSAAARIEINNHLKSDLASEKVKRQQPYDKKYYWLDMGNLQKTGQVVLGTITSSPQPKDSKGKASLKDVVAVFPQLKKIKEENQGPSCSLAEALEKQDLFINSTLAQFGCNLLWKLIREGSIRYHGCFVNLETLTVNPIKI